MPFQVKAGSITAIVANERQALEMVCRLTGPCRGQVSIRESLVTRLTSLHLRRGSLSLNRTGVFWCAPKLVFS
jgi:hypothetical protein